MRKISFTICAVCLAWQAAFCGNPSYRFAEPHGKWWYAPESPELSVTVRNDGAVDELASIALRVDTDAGATVYALCRDVTVPARDSSRVSFGFSLSPGFYHCTFTAGDSVIAAYNIGYEPERILKLPDYRPDLRQFWDSALSELSRVAPEYEIAEDVLQSTALRRAFVVSMKSLEGEEIQGYLLVPRKKGKYPAIIWNLGYNSDAWHPAVDSRPDFIEYVVSVRGQGMNKPTNKHGQWMLENIEDPYRYYYRGAFMDVVRGIDFVCQLPEFDGKNLFAEGGSQGGALTLAACALDDRITAAAPYNPFLSDFPAYFELVKRATPRMVMDAAAAKGITHEQMLENLSYFDMKNLAQYITAPIFMGVGLQDDICPPRTNFAGYNLIQAPKQFVIYPHMGHNVDKSHWESAHLDFYKRYMKK